MDFSPIMIKLLVAVTAISCVMDLVCSASLRPTRTRIGLPVFRRALPMYDDVTAREVDEGLSLEFPGQFYNKVQIQEINTRVCRGRRHRRALDNDLCCVTDVWFGVAGGTIVDASDAKRWPVVVGADVQQAYSRGECHRNNPRSLCPPGGKCIQKYRLHTIWVRNGTEAILQYFDVPSHCAYEPL